MDKTLFNLLNTSAPAATLVVRLLVGLVFFAEGIKKFMFPIEWGIGRFEKIGIIYPHLTAPFVGVVETVCGLLVIFGLFTRPAALLLLMGRQSARNACSPLSLQTSILVFVAMLFEKMSLLLGRLDPANGAKLASEPDDLFIATCLSRTLDAQSLRIPATPETRPFSMMNTIVMTGGTSGLGEVAARRFIETPNTRLLLGARRRGLLGKKAVG